ncbi:fumarylacetoacetate hydrolase family protein [Paraburkholderia tropica]|uniref:fumarylacetoacetate hydrolase family protein n=1 Tax=Paraburkholderia tropica TaxID=92647 RepID=UPI002AB7BAD9|nr:fumarylacetoacetate hydrolase family protein [Paraburkholderia tropica]
MNYLFAPQPVTSVPLLHEEAEFPVHRVYCVGRNYDAHSKEMGITEREAPFFFLKPANAVCTPRNDTTLCIPVPSITHDFQHEVELVVAIGQGGKDIPSEDAHKHILGYAVGLDMTRRDLQLSMRQQGRPWCIGKGFDYSAPIGTISRAENVGVIDQAGITLRVNGAIRQQGTISELIWNVAEIIEQLSAAWELRAGDLIYTGTPAGVGPVTSGDLIECEVTGLVPLSVHIA